MLEPDQGQVWSRARDQQDGGARPGPTGCGVVLGTSRMLEGGEYEQTESSGTQDTEIVWSSRWCVVVSTLKTPVGDTT